jgi:hypothetical protein
LLFFFPARHPRAPPGDDPDEKETRRNSLFGWLVADGWCWFVLREEYCWLVAGGWFDVREKYCWLMADKPSEQGASLAGTQSTPCMRPSLAEWQIR